MDSIYYIFLGLLLLLVVLLVFKTYEGFQAPPAADGYTEACRELNAKRIFLKGYLNALKEPVQDLSASLIAGYKGKMENLGLQSIYTDECLANMTDACKALASVDVSELKALPDIDIFFYNLLYASPDVHNLLKQITFYGDVVGCPNTDEIIKDSSNNILFIKENVGVVDAETLALQLQKLSPYYLSPDVILYILKFLISKTQLDNLHDTYIDFIEQGGPIVKNIVKFYART